MKPITTIFLMLVSTTVLAQQTIRPNGMGGYVIEDSGGCGALFGTAAGNCLYNQQLIQMLQLQQQQQLQQQLQQQQLESQKLQNQILQEKLKQQQSTSQQAPQTNNSLNPEFQAWQLANPWYGTDRAKTEYALLYAKELRQERPDLVGRPFLDSVTAKVEDVFGAKK